MKTLNNNKILSLALTLSIVFTLAGCSNTKTPAIDLKNNERQKEEAFNQIINDRELFNDFMDRMMAETMPSRWMMQNSRFMDHMFSDENYDYIMQHNQGMDRHMMRNMRNRMERDTSLSREWEMMNKQNQMIE